MNEPNKMLPIARSRSKLLGLAIVAVRKSQFGLGKKPRDLMVPHLVEGKANLVDVSMHILFSSGIQGDGGKVC